MTESKQPNSRFSLRKVISFLLVVVAITIATLVVIVPLNLREQVIFGAIVFLAGYLISKLKGPIPRLTIVALSVIVSSRYMYWRITSTLALATALETTLGVILLVAESYAFVVLLLGYLQSAWPLRRTPTPLPADTDNWPAVDVFIPTYNEPLEVVRATVLAAREIDWPEDKLEVWILDDGRREEFREFAEEAGVRYITRSDNKHAKAGNINHALEEANGKFVAIFDCDHVPTRSFLQFTMGIMVKDPKVAMVQTPHHFNSPDPFERNLDTFRSIPNEGQLFYQLLLPGSDLWNAVFFCGSCAVLRRSALDEVGGVAVETVTEDAHTGLRLHRKGYKTVYYPTPQASGLATESLAAHIGQRIRWARGMTQIFRTDNPLFGRGLRLAQRLCYLNSMAHFLNGAPRLIFLTAPLAFLVFGINVFAAPALLVLSYALPHLLHANMTSSRLQGKVRHSFWAEVYEATLAVYILIPTTLALISPRFGKFNVTAKGGLVPESYYNHRIAAPVIVLLLANMVAIGIGIWRMKEGLAPHDALSINIAWAVYNVIILAAAVAVAYETRQLRVSNRIRVRLPAVLHLASNRTLGGQTADLSLTGAAFELKNDVRVPKGEQVHLTLVQGTEEVALPARTIYQSRNLVGVKFDELKLEEEAALVSAIYSRADAWHDWGQEVPRDRPLRSWLRILGYAVIGILRMLNLRRRTVG